MNENSTALDRSERLTNTGLGILRIASGLFFLIPGLFKFFSPDDFLGMMSGFPEFLQPHLPWLFSIVIFAEIVGGIMLIVGWHIRLAVPALVVITVVAELFVVAQDTGSSIRVISLFSHVMGAGLYTSLFFLGSGRWAIGGGKGVLNWIGKRDFGSLSAAARTAGSGAAKNFGIFLIRASVAIPFVAAIFVWNSDASYAAVLPNSTFLSGVLLMVSLLGGLSLFTGFQVASMGWVLVGLTVLHLVFVAIPDISSSLIGYINILFHGLIIAAVASLRLIGFGSDLEVEHILSLDKKNVVVVGGGFAGTQLVKRLERKLPENWRVILISEENYITYNPMLAEVVGATVLPSHVIAPIRRMVRKTRFISARVTRVDEEAKRVHFEGEDRNGTIDFEHLVLAFGSRANLAMIPGMSEHALPFKLLGDALRVRNRVIEQMEKAELEEDAQKRRWLGRFVVIGGGFSGVEVAGAIQDFILSSHKHYPRLQDADLSVTMIHRGGQLLPEMNDVLGERTYSHMSKRGVEILLKTGCTGVDERGVITDSETRVDGGTVICTIGTKANPLIEKMNLPTDRGRILVDPDMSVTGHTNVWAIGDCALIPNALDGEFSPPTAQFAIREGRQLADNIHFAVCELPTQPFNYQSKGSMATIGHLNGVAEVFGKFNFGGFSGWLLWRAFYLSLMPTLAKQTRILFEWTWSMLFSADIINLRFTTTEQADVSRRDEENSKTVG